MTNQVQVFDGLKVREENGQVMFDAESAAIGMGIVETKKNGVTYVIWNRVNKYLGLSTEVSKIGKGDFITESQFYKLAIKANNDTAERFQDWVTTEVLPSIRKTGAYQSQPNVPMDPMSQIQLLASSTYKALEEVQTDMVKLKSLFGLPEDLATDLNSAINSKITYILGGKKSPAYESMSKRAFPAFYRNLRDYFHVTSYKKIPVERFQEAMNYVNNWTPDTNLRLEINRVNAQMSLEV